MYVVKREGGGAVTPNCNLELSQAGVKSGRCNSVRPKIISECVDL